MNDTDVYGKQQKLSLTEFLAELFNLIAVAASAVLTGSLITWMDLVDSLGNVIRRGFVALMSGKLKRNLKYEYNYGIGKVEAIASLCCEFFLVAGLLCVAVFSVMEIFKPERPSDLLIYAVLLKAINVSTGVYFLVRQRKLCKSGSSMIKSEYKGAIQSLVFDSIALVSLLVCYVLRDVRAVWYFAPALCLAVSVYFFAGCVPRIRAAVRELADRTLPEDKQLLILKALNDCYDCYAELISVKSHLSGGRVFIDLDLTFEDGASYGEIRAFLRSVSEKIRAVIPDSVVHITISE